MHYGKGEKKKCNDESFIYFEGPGAMQRQGHAGGPALALLSCRAAAPSSAATELVGNSWRVIVFGTWGYCLNSCL